MTSDLPVEITEYLELVETSEGGKMRFCKEQIAFAAYVRRVFREETILIRTDLIEKYMSLQKYFPFDLFPWEKCVVSLWLCCFREDGLPRWKELDVLGGRGLGKDGLISFCCFCLVSPYHPVKRYNVDICANSEEQAMTPVQDLREVLEDKRQEKKLAKHFYHTKEIVQGRVNRGIIRGRTKNADTKDGLRTGAIILNEVHQYQNYDNINVYTTGLGKSACPRIGVFSSNGDISDGPYDDYVAAGNGILFDNMPDNGKLPFFCKLDAPEEVEDERNWMKANPSLPYLPNLMEEIRDEFRQWKLHPEQHGSFMTKRMGIRKTFSEIAVTDYERIKSTNRPLPVLLKWSCTVGLDYAELSDWASVVFHFRRGEERFDIHHSWICLQSKTLNRINAPWQAWADLGKITPVDDVTISPKLLADYIRRGKTDYNVKGLAMDGFRWTLVSDAMKEIGFDAKDKEKVHLVRPSDIMKVDPVIQDCFDRELFCWGDDPSLRWATNNTKRVRAGRTNGGIDTGNFIFAKIEPKSRKTDPFMALVAAMTIEDRLTTRTVTRPATIGVIEL